MIILRDLQSDLEKLPPKRLVIAIGNFDGLHLGHQAVIGRAVDIARQQGYAAAVLTFRQHPRSVLCPESPPVLLLPPDEKVRRIEQMGVDVLLCLDFTPELAERSPEQFIDPFLCKQLKVSQVVVGHNFRFGKERRGTPDLLQAKGPKLGFQVTIIPPVQIGDQIVSSTNIRRLLRQGRVREASVFLNREYEITGEVIPGDGRGKRLGFPTANLAVESELIPANGVYAAWAVHQGRRYAAMVNIGRRPTFPGANEAIEVHLIGFEGDLYGEPLDIHFVDRVRCEQSFTGIDELREQLSRDREQVLALLDLNSHTQRRKDAKDGTR